RFSIYPDSRADIDRHPGTSLSEFNRVLVAEPLALFPGLRPVLNRQAGDHVQHLAVARGHDLLTSHVQLPTEKKKPLRVQFNLRLLPFFFQARSRSLASDRP